MKARTLVRVRTRLRQIGLGLALGWCAATPASALVVSAGTPLSTAPAELGIVLAAGQFLVPVQASGAVDLQAWNFDLYYDDQVVQRLTFPGDYGVYAGVFGGEPALFTSTGFDLPGLVDDVAGFFFGGVNGDGLLAYVAFQYLGGQTGQDPGLSVDTPPEPQPIPEPATAWLLAGALATLLSLRRHVRAPGLLAATAHSA